MKLIRLLLLTLMPALANAADNGVDGVYEMNFMPIKSKGELVGCSLVYKAALIDQFYVQGRVLSVIGSATFQSFPEQKTAGMSFKMGVGEIINNTLQPINSEGHYLESDGKVLRPKIIIDAESPGYKLLMYDLENVAPVLEAIYKNNLHYGFSLPGGQLDLTGRIDFTQNYQNSHFVHSNVMIDGFGKCVSSVTEAVRKKLQ